MTLLVEGAVGGLHAIRAPRLYMARHLALMTFILGTYLLLPVIGFAFVLTVLGLAQCHERDTAMRLRYLALLCLVQFTIVPWVPAEPRKCRPVTTPSCPAPDPANGTHWIPTTRHRPEPLQRSGAEVCYSVPGQPTKEVSHGDTSNGGIAVAPRPSRCSAGRMAVAVVTPGSSLGMVLMLAVGITAATTVFLSMP